MGPPRNMDPLRDRSLFERELKTYLFGQRHCVGDEHDTVRRFCEILRRLQMPGLTTHLLNLPGTVARPVKSVPPSD